MTLLGPEGRRQLIIQRNPRNLHDTQLMLDRFKQFLGNFPPSAQLAKDFMAQYAERKP